VALLARYFTKNNQAIAFNQAIVIMVSWVMKSQGGEDAFI